MPQAGFNNLRACISFLVGAEVHRSVGEVLHSIISAAPFNSDDTLDSFLSPRIKTTSVVSQA